MSRYASFLLNDEAHVVATQVQSPSMAPPTDQMSRPGSVVIDDPGRPTNGRTPDDQARIDAEWAASAKRMQDDARKLREKAGRPAAQPPPTTSATNPGQPSPTRNYSKFLLEDDKKPAPEPVETWGEWAGNIPGRAKDAMIGKHDPAYKGLPSYDEANGSISLGMFAGYVGGVDDKGYGDIIQKHLGDKFSRRFKDANGYEIIEHLADDGKMQQAYVNKPGLDLPDVVRGGLGAIPYAVGGAAVAGLKGLRTAGQMGAQAVAAATTSLAGDVTSYAAGSEQGPDLVKAGVTGAIGGAGAAVAPVVGAFWRKFVTVPGLVKDGQLTQKGIDAARRGGVDPAELQGKVAEEFAKVYSKTGDAARAATDVNRLHYGVEQSLGQRTKDAQQILKEKNMAAGLYDDEAKATMTAFNERQQKQLTNMVLGDEANAAVSNVPNMPGMAKMIDQSRDAAQRTKQALGADIQAGVEGARDAAKAGERAAWKETGDLTPQKSAFDDITSHITGQLAGRRLTTKYTPAALDMEHAIASYAKGEMVAGETKLIQQAPAQTIDDMRRHLKSIAGDAVTPSDKAASKAMLDGFNDWTKASAKKQLLNGDPEGAAKMFKAIDVSREKNAIFDPRGAGNRPNASTAKMSKILDGADTPELIVSALFSAGKTDIKAGSIQTLQTIKAGLDKYAGPGGADTWNAIRVAHWTKLINTNTGELAGTQAMMNNIKGGLANQKSMLDVLYTPAEQTAMKRIVKVLEDVHWKDPNPSGTATAVGLMGKEFLGTLMNAIPKPVKMAIEMTKIPNLLKRGVGAVDAREAVNQGTRATTDPNLGGPAATLGSMYYGGQR
jgi:hypothetical protein